MSCPRRLHPDNRGSAQARPAQTRSSCSPTHVFVCYSWHSLTSPVRWTVGLRLHQIARLYAERQTGTAPKNGCHPDPGIVIDSNFENVTASVTALTLHKLRRDRVEVADRDPLHILSVQKSHGILPYDFLDRSVMREAGQGPARDTEPDSLAYCIHQAIADENG